MIWFLSIRHLAIVDELELEFEPGLTVFTGETGAGKSIVLNALGLLIGERATSELVRTAEEKAVVQASLETMGREVVVRREVTAQGRSRAFIDDALASAGALKELGRQIVDLHGQHEHQALLDPRNHLSLLDAYGKATQLMNDVHQRFDAWRTAKNRLKQAQLSDQEKAERFALLTFQLSEIERVAPLNGEDESLTASHQRLANAERVQTVCGEVYGDLYERDDAILSTLGSVWRKVEELAALDKSFEPYVRAREDIRTQLEDFSFFLRSYLADIEVSPDRLTEIEARLSDLERLKKKYGPGLAEVLDRQRRIIAELDTLASGAEKLAALEASERSAREKFLVVAHELSARRRRDATALVSCLRPVLHDLAMPRAIFEVHFQSEDPPEERWSGKGIDAPEFFLSANTGEAVRPLAKVASGGELSRLMLALKSLASNDQPGKTLVFDEVDTGIGGEVADRVGLLLQGLSSKFQVICVTHLPQIAAHAKSHFHVSKLVRDGRTVTQVELLGVKERVSELARLMTGGASPQALASARELLETKQIPKDESEKAKAKG